MFDDVRQLAAGSTQMICIMRKQRPIRDGVDRARPGAGGAAGLSRSCSPWQPDPRLPCVCRVCAGVAVDRSQRAGPPPAPYSPPAPPPAAVGSFEHPVCWWRGEGGPGPPQPARQSRSAWRRLCFQRTVPGARKQPSSKPLWASPRSPMIILCGLLISKLNPIITHCLASWL